MNSSNNRRHEEEEPLLGGGFSRHDEKASWKSLLFTAWKQFLLPMLVVVPLLVVLFRFFPPGNPGAPGPFPPGPPAAVITQEAFEYGIRQCVTNKVKSQVNPDAFLTGKLLQYEEAQILISYTQSNHNCRWWSFRPTPSQPSFQGC
jgi:hypothetical protein